MTFLLVLSVNLLLYLFRTGHIQHHRKRRDQEESKRILASAGNDPLYSLFGPANLWVYRGRYFLCGISVGKPGGFLHPHWGMGFVLSCKSDNLEGAWEFVKYFLTADFLKSKLYEIEGSGLPVRRDIFYEKAQIAAVQEGYCFINDEFVSLPPMTQEQIDKEVNFIGGLHNAAFEDEVIMNIIYEEAESFFQGQKTAEDVAGLIQNRVQLYISEGT